MKLIGWDHQRLKELVALWNSEIGMQFPLREELFIQNSFDDANVLRSGSFIAINDEDQVIGFVVSKCWQENLDVQMNHDIGWIQVLLVKSSYRCRGIGSALLGKAEQALKERNIKTVHIGRDPWHYFPGIPKNFEKSKTWFEKRNYVSGYIEYDLIRHDQNRPNCFNPSRYDVQFTLLKKEEKHEFLSFLQRCFPGRWEYEAIHYFQRGGTGREFVIAKKNGNIIGFCRINDHNSPYIAQNVYWAPLVNEALGGIGPLGIDPNERKNGYGLAIVEAGISFLRERNIHSIVIDWTGLVNFYGKLDFVIWKEYQQMSKDLSKELKR
ncbi:GNAT family N-acetyltransferase [Neobacillus vireti]|uniref:GNAT family N-acetyltransferase n=1 Tax=Neobacillus vireti TaxID=220686 RepID=UPI0030002E72